LNLSKTEPDDACFWVSLGRNEEKLDLRLQLVHRETMKSLSGECSFIFLCWRLLYASNAKSLDLITTQRKKKKIVRTKGGGRKRSHSNGFGCLFCTGPGEGECSNPRGCPVNAWRAERTLPWLRDHTELNFCYGEGKATGGVIGRRGTFR